MPRRRPGRVSVAHVVALLLPTVVCSAVVGISWYQGDLLWLGRLTGRRAALGPAAEGETGGTPAPPAAEAALRGAAVDDCGRSERSVEPDGFRADVSSARDAVPAEVPEASNGGDSAERRRRAAASKLRLALRFFDQGRDDVARRWLQQLASEYPETEAGVLARRYLMQECSRSDLQRWVVEHPARD